RGLVLCRTLPQRRGKPAGATVRRELSGLCRDWRTAQSSLSGSAEWTIYHDFRSLLGQASRNLSDLGPWHLGQHHRTPGLAGFLLHLLTNPGSAWDTASWGRFHPG